MAESKKLALKKQQATAKIFQGPQYIHVQGHAKMLQLTRSWEIDTLNATKDRDSHHGVMSTHKNTPQRANGAHGASGLFRQYFMAFVF